MKKRLSLLLPLALISGVSNAAIVSMASNSTYDADTAAMDLALGLAGKTIEDFEDVNLVPGLTIEYLNPDNGPASTLPMTYTDGSGSFFNNSWDGTRALVNTFDNDIWFGGPNGNQLAKIVQLITFNVGSVDFVGVGLGNFQADIADHALFVNGVEVMPALENLVNFTSGIQIRNGYLLVQAESGEAINSIGFELRLDGTSTPANNDGLIFDHLAIGNTVSPIPVPAAVWLFGSALLGLTGFCRHRKKT